MAGNAVTNELCLGLEPNDAAVAVAKWMNPSKAMMSGSNGREAVGLPNLRVPVEGLETAQELWESFGIGRSVFANVHHEFAQVSGLDLVTLATLGSGPVQRFREPGIKFTMKPAGKVAGVNI